MAVAEADGNFGLRGDEPWESVELLWEESHIKIELTDPLKARWSEKALYMQFV